MRRPARWWRRWVRVDPDAGESFTYTLAADPSGMFEVVGNEVRLKAGASLDYEAPPRMS